MFDYKDTGLTKPVKYTTNFLKEIASKTSTIILTNEHTTEELGLLSNFIYRDGELLAETPENITLKGKGISPVFEGLTLEDKGEYYLPIEGDLTKAGLTSKPRTKILYNSIINEKNEMDDDKMSNETLDVLVADKKKAEDEVATLKYQLEQTKGSLKKQEETKTKLAEAEKLKKQAEDELNKYKEKADKYDELQENKKNELLDELFNEDEQSKQKFESFSYDQLKAIKEHQTINRPPKGVGQNGAPGLDDEGLTPSDGGDDVLTDEKYEQMKREGGVY